MSTTNPNIWGPNYVLYSSADAASKLNANDAFSILYANSSAVNPEAEAQQALVANGNLSGSPSFYRDGIDLTYVWQVGNRFNIKIPILNNLNPSVYSTSASTGGIFYNVYNNIPLTQITFGAGKTTVTFGVETYTTEDKKKLISF
jgi:hypothetical protein